MDIREVARKGGKSRSEKKQAAARRNLALARASIKLALDAYKHAPNEQVKTEALGALKSSTNMFIEADKKASVQPTLLQGAK